MALTDPKLTKTYRDRLILTEDQLDAWRVSSENAFAQVNLNLEQLRKDLFLSTYAYDNDGASNLSSSLQEQINLLAGGGTPITGTTSSSFAINSSGNGITISTSGLTATRTITSPDESGQVCLIGATQTLTNKTLTDPVISGSVQTFGTNTPGWTSNVSLSINTGTGVVKLIGNNGNDHSSSNPGWFTLKSVSNPGRFVRLKLTSAVSFIDDTGSSDIVGNYFGLSSGDTYSESRPFYIYAVNSDDTDAGLGISISPCPNYKVTPATTNLGYKANPASTQSDLAMFFWTSTNITTTHDEKPCMNIGGITATMSSSNDWTFDALTEKTGIGADLEDIQFVFPTGVKGNGSGAYFSTAGTAPTFATQSAIFWAKKSGLTTYALALINTSGGTAGSGANDLTFNLPLDMPISQNAACPAVALTNTSYYETYVNLSPASNGQATVFLRSSGRNLQCGDLPAAIRRIAFSCTYQSYSAVV